MLQSLLRPFSEGYPSFMRTQAWQDKNLQTALASWAQLRHDTILYVKQSLAAAEGGEERPLVKGYVEPNVEAWKRLLHLVRQTRQLLQPRGLLLPNIAEKLDVFEDLVDFLLRCAEKELQNRPLADEYEYRRLQDIGGKMDYLALYVMSDGRAYDWSEIVHPADRNMACVADVHTADIRFGGLGHVALEEAVGHAHEIFVIVPIEGQLVLARGAVFSYYEFLQKATERLTDEQWQEKLKKRQVPLPPEWTRSFMTSSRVTVRPLPVR